VPDADKTAADDVGAQRDSVRRATQALRRLLTSEGDLQRLRSSTTGDALMKELGLPASARTDLLNVLDVVQARAALAGPASGSATAYAEADNQLRGAESFFEKAFLQLENAYTWSKRMSITMFFAGLAFLAAALLHGFLRPEAIATTSVVGGIGVVQIVALFYKNPLADLATAVSNAQQAKIALSSYIMGIALIRDAIGVGPPTEVHVKMLVDLTENALKQLQTYTEPPPQA
jgi:hypothetical protein